MPDDLPVDIGDLEVKRWRRYGKDRLYVEAADGTKVGYWDLEAGTAHPASPELSGLLEQAVAAWRAPGPASAEAELGAADAEAPRPWVDLASNPPGAAAREQAEAARAAAPVKTLLARVLKVHTDERA
jgi:hypothetical protein